MSDTENHPLFKMGVSDNINGSESAVGLMLANEDRDGAMIYFAGWVRGSTVKMKQLREAFQNKGWK